MHNRDTIWTTVKGEKIKIKDLSNEHLMNIIEFLKKKKKAEMNGVKLKTIKQELRLRKLNNIENNPDYNEIF